MAPSRTASLALVAAAILSGTQADQHEMDLTALMGGQGGAPDMSALMETMPSQCKDYEASITAMMGAMGGTSSAAAEEGAAQFMKSLGTSEQCQPFMAAIMEEMGDDDDEHDHDHDGHDHEEDEDDKFECMFDEAHFPQEGSDDYPTAEMIKAMCDCGSAGVDKAMKDSTMTGACMGAMMGSMMGGMMGGMMGDMTGDAGGADTQAQIDAAMAQMKTELEKTMKDADDVMSKCSSKALLEKLCGETAAKVEEAKSEIKAQEEGSGDESSARRASLFMSAVGALAWIMS